MGFLYAQFRKHCVLQTTYVSCCSPVLGGDQCRGMLGGREAAVVELLRDPVTLARLVAAYRTHRQERENRLVQTGPDERDGRVLGEPISDCETKGYETVITEQCEPASETQVNGLNMV